LVYTYIHTHDTYMHLVEGFLEFFV
jgi:hypothetical protein